MPPKIIHIEPNEEITSVVNRLIESDDVEIVLAVPTGARIFKDLINVKLLKREANALSKRVSILTGDEIGYRFDWKTKKIVITGSLFIKAEPNQARIFLNEKFEKETSLVWNTALISNLKPKIYGIRVEKDGFWPWYKNLDVKPELVTEARNIILFPKKPSVEKALEDGVAEFWPSPDGSKIIYLAESNPQRPPTGGDGEKTSVYFDLKISDLKTGSEIFLNQTGKLCQNNIQNAEQNCRMIWNGAGDKILVSQKTPERWELLEINWSEKKAAISPFFQKPYKAKGQAAGFLPIINPIFNPKNGNEIIYLDGGLLYSINIESGLAAKLTLGDEIIAFTASGNSIFYFLASERSEKPSVSHFQANDKNKNSDFYFSEKSEDLTLKHPEIYLFQTSKDGKQQIKLGSIPAELKIKDRFVSPEILISENNEIAVLVPQNSGQTLYYLKSEIGEFAEIAENADGASFSPDEKKLLYFNKNEIGVYYLEEVLIQPYKKAGDKSELTRLNEKIENALWYSDSEHIIFWADKKVKISELDDRNGINIVDFLDAENPRIFYDFRSENLYFTNGGILSKTKF